MPCLFSPAARFSCHTDGLAPLHMPCSGLKQAGTTRPALFLPLALAVAVLLWPAHAHAQGVRSCKHNQVEYLVGGGGGGGGSDGSICSSGDDGVLTTPRSRSRSAAEPLVGDDTGRKSVVMRPDDEGRREILNQELQNEQRAINRLATAKPSDSAEQAQQLTRHRANLTALEAEIRRLK